MLIPNQILSLSMFLPKSQDSSRSWKQFDNEQAT